MINILQLDPELQEKLQEFELECMKQYQIVVKPIQGWRDIATQLHLYEQKLSANKGFDGPHTQIEDGLPCSKAFDFACFDDHGNYIKDGTHPNYQNAGKIAKSIGLIWGGDFKHTADGQPDWDHCELANWRKI